MTSLVDNPPDASRVINSLRDTGYNFETAVADLVDNSIAAKATKVVIRVEMDYLGEVSFSIADNGEGMTRDDLVRAMRYGAPQQQDPYRLGKFGLGLKTASTAFCRRLEVTSRTASTDTQSAAWDLDTIAKRNAWTLELDSTSEEQVGLLEEASGSKAGTLVEWKKVDRFFGRQYKNSAGGHAKKALEKKVEMLREHLGLTFQRFIEGRASHHPTALEITVNGEPVHPWDPFCSKENGCDTKTFQIPIEIDRDGRIEEAEARLRTVILPAQSEFSSREAYEAARISTEYQGIYVYRHDRLLTHGTWLKLYAVHSSHNMLRVELSFDYRLDDIFSVPVDKSNIDIDPELAEALKTMYLKAPVQEAEKRRAGALRRKQVSKKNDIHVPSNQNLAEQSPSIPQPDVRVLDAGTGDVEVTNRTGKVRITLPVRERPEADGIFIQPVSELVDGVLFEPLLTNGQHGVQINITHDFYRRVYLPNRENGAAIMGMDALLWGLSVAELNNCTPATALAFREIRFELSRILRRLVEKLPDPVLEADE